MITRSAVFRVKDRLRNELGQAQIARLDAIANLLAEDGRSSLAAVLAALYPSLPRETALSNFRQFRLILNTAAKRANVNLALETDGQNKRSSPESRAVWFTGDDEITEGLNQIIEAEEYGLQRTSQTAVRLGTITYDFARANGEGDDLIDELETHFKTAANYQFIRTPGAECDLIIELVSPAYLATRPTREWLCRVVPVLYKEIDETNTDQRGLERLKKFTFDNRPWTNAKKPKSVSALFADICRVCSEPWLPAIALPECEDFPGHVRSHGVPSKLEKQQSELIGERRDALEFLHAWCVEPNGPRYCALLGEYGIGKTTTVRKFASERKAQQRQTIYLDLRLMGREAAEKDIELTRILDIILAKSWKSGSVERLVKPREAIKLVRDHGALVIFDGLDEVLVHLTPTQGQHFTRELFRILPPSLKSEGKMLVTCRSHYFRTFRDQVTHLTAESRDNINKEDYRALVLLPFTEDQIREYLKKTLPNDDPDRILALFESVHNLREMAERPYTLSLLTNQLHQIEQWKAAGEKVTGYRLYGHMVLEWLERDAGKHTLTTDHKQCIMEFFAAELWKSGQKTWKIGDIETWLLKFLRANEDIAIHYEVVSRELLKEDLRTATFLVREGDDEFRFAHTSLQEFFLAGYLRRALIEGALNRWAIPRVSPETLEFLGQALNANEVEPLKSLRDTYTPLASELAFEYFLVATKGDYPRVSGAGFQLPGIDLRERTIANADLPKINLTGARLRQSVWQNVNLLQACFANASAPLAEFHACRLDRSAFDRADLTAAAFRQCRMLQTSFQQTRERHVQRPGAPSANRGTLVPQTGHKNGIQACAVSLDGRRVLSAGPDCTLRLWDPETGEILHTMQGHYRKVTSCAFSPDGRRALSGSQDRTLRIWDLETGEAARTLQGHSGNVTSCAFSADGRLVLSGSNDCTLRVWNQVTGETLRILKGHSGDVMSCAFSPDSRLVLSGSNDCTLRVWDQETGETLRTLLCGDGSLKSCTFSPDGRRAASEFAFCPPRVWDLETGETLCTLQGGGDFKSCAFSGDGRQLLSVSWDSTLRWWNVETGEILRILRGIRIGFMSCTLWPDGRRVLSGFQDSTLRVHDMETDETLRTLQIKGAEVTTCAFSPDGRRVLSGSADRMLHVWATETGALLCTLQGHSGGLRSCRFSPDGRLLLSASSDNTLRLWDVESGQSLRILRGHSGGVRSCAFSPDGRLALSASCDCTLRIWDVETGETVRTLHSYGSRVSSCAFSPDGSHVLGGCEDNIVRIWAAETGETLRRLQGHSGWISTCAFSLDGRHVLAASLDSVLRARVVETGRMFSKFQGHLGLIWACAFSPDGGRVLSASDDQTLCLWDVETGQEIQTFRGHAGDLNACDFSPDGRRIVSGSDDGTLRLWDAETGKQIGWQAYHFPDGGTFSVTVDKPQRIISHGPNSWRYVRWETRNEKGELDLLPSDL